MSKKREKEKGILFYEEGYAENFLYTRIMSYLLTCSKYKYRIKHKNLKGEGNTRQIPTHYRIDMRDTNIEYTVFFCYDTDVSKHAIGKKPSIRWDDAKREVKELGVKKVYEIKQQDSIEDILLGDLEGILSYLSLPKDTKVKGDGNSVLKSLYNKAEKVYVHSNRQMMDSLIKALNIEKIMIHSKESFIPLLKMFPDISFDK